MGYRLAIVAGEHSGDTHGGHLAAAFNKLVPGSKWFGAGGPTLTSVGMDVVVPMEKLAVVGIGEVLSSLPGLWLEMNRLKRTLRERRPDALLLVDFPDFNFRLAKYARALGIPVVYYITPQVWAWRRGRTRFLRRYVNRALVIFPFEESFLQAHGVDARFVGHPLIDTAHTDSSLESFLFRHSIGPEIKRVSLLPGSRASEVKRNLPPMMEAASRLLHTRREMAIFVPWAEGLPEKLKAPYQGFGVRWVKDYRDVLGYSQAAVVASGTATLEAALMGVPSTIVYRVKALTYAMGKRLVKLPYVGLPNVVLGRAAIPEFIQGEFTAERVVHEVERMVETEEASERNAASISSEIRQKLGKGNASARAAEELLEFLNDYPGAAD